MLKIKNGAVSTGRRFCTIVICISIFSAFFLAGCVPPIPGNRTSQHMNPQHQPGETGTYYAGYSKNFLPYKEKLCSGKIEDVQQAMLAEEEEIKGSKGTDAELAEKLRLVGLMERATLALQSGDADKTHDYCRMAQTLIEERESQSYFNEGVDVLEKIFLKFGGGGEYGRYDAPGYEKVLLLDIEAMAYLLQGDERAFNVARLAILWQNEEKEKFEDKLEEASKKAEENLQKEADNEEKKQQSAKMLDTLQAEFSKYDDIALQVPNAFVNPFGDYITGMVNEFKSLQIKSLLSNAHIAYKQALELNPKSKVLQQAVKDTKKKKSASRLIHVVALDGFVPEKKVLSIPIYSELDIELPTYEPVASKVTTLKVTTMDGKLLATFSPVANVEALALRLQKDALPTVQAMVVAAAVRDIAIVQLGNKLYSGLGRIFRRALDRFQEPDTTSWMSLPSTILAARFYPPKGLKKLKIKSYDGKGKKLAEQTVKLNKGSRHFVLVRSIDETMYAYPSKKIWSAKSSYAQTN